MDFAQTQGKRVYAAVCIRECAFAPLVGWPTKLRLGKGVSKRLPGLGGKVKPRRLLGIPWREVNTTVHKAVNAAPVGPLQLILHTHIYSHILQNVPFANGQEDTQTSIQADRRINVDIQITVQARERPQLQRPLAC